MILVVKEMIRRTGGDDMVYFQTAYIWRYGKHYHCIADVIEFRTHGVIPLYVSEYTHHLL